MNGTATASASRQPARMPARTRRPSPAPMFWAVKEDRPLDRVEKQVMAKVLSRMAAEYPAMHAAP